MTWLVAAIVVVGAAVLAISAVVALLVGVAKAVGEITGGLGVRLGMLHKQRNIPA